MWKKIVIASMALGAGMAYAYMPQAGTWIMTAESNGQPGRGFGLDVQNDTLVMQMYGYETNGSPTFYLSAGKIANNQYTGVLNKYRDGRFFGSGDRDAREDGNAGTVKMRFTSGTKGFIQFPNEPEKAIARFNFAYDTSAQSLKGIWMLTALNRDSATRDQIDYFLLDTPIRGTSYSSGAMATKDGQYTCESLTSGPNAGLVFCAQFNLNGSIRRVNFFELSVNEGEGNAGPSSNNATDVLHVKRVRNPAENFTGIVLKSQPVIDPEQVSRALQEQADIPVDRAQLKHQLIDQEELLER